MILNIQLDLNGRFNNTTGFDETNDTSINNSQSKPDIKSNAYQLVS